MVIKRRAAVEEALTADSTNASVPTGVPNTGWPEATVEPSPRSRAAARMSCVGREGSPRMVMVRERAAIVERRDVGAERHGP